MSFWRVLDVLNKRKWLILFSVVVTTVLTWAATGLVGSKWDATVSFYIPPNAPTAVTTPTEQAQQSALDGLMAMTLAKAKAQYYGSISKSSQVLSPALQKSGLIAMPADQTQRIEFTPINGRLYELHVTDPNPILASRLANNLADQLIARLKEDATSKSGSTVTELNRHLAAVEAKLKTAQAKKDQLTNTTGSLTNEIARSREMALQRYQQVMSQRDGLTSAIASEEANLRSKISELNVLPLTVPGESRVTTPPTIRPYQEAYANAEIELKKLQLKYTDDHPLVKTAQRDRDQAKADLDAVKQTAKPTETQVPNQKRVFLDSQVSDLKHRISGDRAQLASLNLEVDDAIANLNNFKTAINPISKVESEIVQLNMQSADLTNRINYATADKEKAERQTELVIMERSGEVNPPVNTTASRTKKVILLALFCSLIGAAGLAIGLDSIDRRLKSVNEAEIVLPARILAAIPQPMGAVTYSTLARATELQPQSLHSEAYRFLGLHLLNSHSNIRSLMVLSAKAEQGSTTTVTNLAITLAQAGKRVIIVDANVRTAELHQVFETENDFGFSDLIMSPDAASWEKALKPTSTPNLSVITSGNRPDNPWEMFRSPHLRELSNKLREMADYVLYDTPSALIFTDALNLAPVVDAAFMCVRAYEPLTGAEQRLIDLLKEAGVPVLGSVLNDVPASVVEGYHNYQHYYAPAITAGDAEPTPIATGVARPIVEVTKSSRNGHGNDGPSLS